MRTEPTKNEAQLISLFVFGCTVGSVLQVHCTMLVLLGCVVCPARDLLPDSVWLDLFEQQQIKLRKVARKMMAKR